jgi:hypothetical protein
MRLHVLGPALLLLSLDACGDPVRDAAVANLGPEAPFVAPGPLHRPGQPCLLCHRDGGQALSFSIAGTVFLQASSDSPAANVPVYILDSAHKVFTTSTNCAGNFYVTPDQFSPTYPFWVTLRSGRLQRDMDSAVYRDGSCAGCHVGTAGPTTPGRVYLIDNPMTQMPPASNCK